MDGLTTVCTDPGATSTPKRIVPKFGIRGSFENSFNAALTMGRDFIAGFDALDASDRTFGS